MSIDDWRANPPMGTDSDDDDKPPPQRADPPAKLNRKRAPGEGFVSRAQTHLIKVASGAWITWESCKRVLLYMRLCEAKNWAKIDDSHDYLLALPIRSLTLARAEALALEAEACQARVWALASVEPEQLWKTDLDTLNYRIVIASSAERPAAGGAEISLASRLLIRCTVSMRLYGLPKIRLNSQIS
jgi:hypothetical protein